MNDLWAIATSKFQIRIKLAAFDLMCYLLNVGLKKFYFMYHIFYSDYMLSLFSNVSFSSHPYLDMIYQIIYK